MLKKSYQYNTDGRLKFTQDQLTTNSKFDRLYEYDHMGRVTKALTGAEARGGPTGWRGIVPLKSTRADVERILGPPTDKSGITYFSDGSVGVQYSVRPCDSGWDVPPETVIALGIRAEPSIPLADLHLDLTKYKKVRGDADVSDHFYYADEERGFAISVRDGMINSYIYEPTAKDKSRRCTDSPK